MDGVGHYLVHNICFLWMVRGERMADVKLNVTLNGVDEAQRKAEQLENTIKEAKSLAGDLAGLLKNLSVEVKS